MKYDEGKLWAAVITRAIQDMAGKNLKLKKEACQWIRSRSFETVCELANLDFTRLKNMLNKIIGKGDSMAQNIKSLLINNINECVTYLLPNGKFHQDKLYIGKLGEDEIIVKVKGEKIGNWHNISKSKSGDILDLWTLITKNIQSAERWLSTKEKQGIKAFSVGHYLNDKSPMPKDIIGPRILTPGGLLVIGGTPKVGKSIALLIIVRTNHKKAESTA